jgi:hypothetical protein
MTSPAADPAVAKCPTCQQPRDGRYCMHCGEEAIDPHRQTVRHFVTHTVLHELLHLDGKIWRTLRHLLFNPGFLTQEYCAGRRRRYINPVRLLITAIITHALLTQTGFVVTISLGYLVLSIAPAAAPQGASIAETIDRIDRFGVLKKVLDKQNTADVTSATARDKFHARLKAFAQPLSFANVLLLALALFAVFHRKRPFFVEHGVFSMHLMSFVLFSGLGALPAVWFFDDDRTFAQIAGFMSVFGVIVWQFVYLTASIRRFYFASEPRTFHPKLRAAAAALFIYLLYSALITAVQLNGGALALWIL